MGGKLGLRTCPYSAGDVLRVSECPLLERFATVDKAAFKISTEFDAVPIGDIMKAETFSRPDNGDVDQGWALLAVCWAFVLCAFISTLLRIWVRWRITRNLGSDDWVIVAAMVQPQDCLFDSLMLLSAQLLSLTPSCR